MILLHRLTARLRRVVLGAALLVLAAVSVSVSAAADTLDDLRKPSSTIAGCLNDWGPLGAGGGVAPTCEGQAALAEWNAHAAAVNVARDTLVNASNLPADRIDPGVVVAALIADAAALDAMHRLFDPGQQRPRGFADVLAWMRPWFERQHLPIPGSIGDGFRTLADAIAKLNLLLGDRIALYGQAAVFGTRVSELATDLGGDVQRQTDAAVRAAHVAALQVAQTVEDGANAPDAGTAIATAAGPGHAALAREQTRQLDQSLAAHPDQGSYLGQTTRKLWAIPKAFLWIAAFVLLMCVLGFRRLVSGAAATGEI